MTCGPSIARGGSLVPEGASRREAVVVWRRDAERMAARSPDLCRGSRLKVCRRASLAVCLAFDPALRAGPESPRATLNAVAAAVVPEEIITDTIWAASPAGLSKSSGRRPHHGHPGNHSWATGRLGGDATTPFP